MLFDRGGGGPQAQPRAPPCLIGLPEGEGSALTLTACGVWLVQIPLAQEKSAAGSTSPATNRVGSHKLLTSLTMTGAAQHHERPENAIRVFCSITLSTCAQSLIG